MRTNILNLFFGNFKFPIQDKMFVIVFIAFTAISYGFPIQKSSLFSWNQNPQKFLGHQVWRINVKKSQLEFINMLESVILSILSVKARMIDIWSSQEVGGSLDFRIAPEDIQSVRTLLLQDKITDVKVIIADVQEAIDDQLKRPPHSDTHQFVLNSKDFFESYHTLDEIQEYIDDLANRYPNIVKPFAIG